MFKNCLLIGTFGLSTLGTCHGEINLSSKFVLYVYIAFMELAISIDHSLVNILYQYKV